MDRQMEWLVDNDIYKQGKGMKEGNGNKYYVCLHFKPNSAHIHI